MGDFLVTPFHGLARFLGWTETNARHQNEPAKGVEPSDTDADRREDVSDQLGNARHAGRVVSSACQPPHFALLVQHHCHREFLDLRKGVRPNLQGEMERLEFTGQDLVICIASGEWKIAFADSRMLADGTDLKNLQGKNHVDVSAPLQLLVEHFEIPDVPDVSTVNSEGFRRNLETLDALEQSLRL